MKINDIICKILLVMILIITCNSSICYADIKLPPDKKPPERIEDTFEGESPAVQGDSSTKLPTITDAYKPEVNLGDNATSAVGEILGVFNVIGAIAIVISIALIGFNTILGTASEKAVAQEKYIGILIAAAVITGGTMLAKIIISAVENF